MVNTSFNKLSTFPQQQQYEASNWNTHNPLFIYLTFYYYYYICKSHIYISTHITTWKESNGYFYPNKPFDFCNQSFLRTFFFQNAIRCVYGLTRKLHTLDYIQSHAFFYFPAISKQGSQIQPNFLVGYFLSPKTIFSLSFLSNKMLRIATLAKVTTKPSTLTSQGRKRP